MDNWFESPKIQLELDQAMGLVRQDRWLLGAVRDGRLRVISDSGPEGDRPFRRVRALSHLARRCLHDRKPLTVSAVSLVEEDPRLSGDWERDWPALLYAPVGVPGRRPVGLLLVGSRGEHWYPQEEIDYVAAIGLSLTATVIALDAPVARLNRHERAAARLVSQGLSVSEIAAALDLDRRGAGELLGTVLRKLSLRSPRQLADVWPELTPLAN